MMRYLPLMLVVLSVAACGVQRPLIKPKDIPAYEEQQRRKIEKIEKERIEEQLERERNAAVAAEGVKE